MDFSQVPLFSNISDFDCERMLTCFETTRISLSSDQELDIGERFFHHISIVLKGSVEISRIDYNGRKSILEIVEKNEMFGRLYTFSPEDHGSIIARCIKPSDIVFIPNEHIEKPCGNACYCHTTLITNLLELMSRKTNRLSARVNVLSQRTIREKLISYFSQLAAASGSENFMLPYSMTTLADYLCVDRSAMTRELRNMKKDGLIEAEGKSITLLQ